MKRTLTREKLGELHASSRSKDMPINWHFLRRLSIIITTSYTILSPWEKQILSKFFEENDE